MRLGLIPVSDGSDVVGEGLKFAVGIPTQRLDGHPQIAAKSDGVKDMEAVKAMAGHFARVRFAEGVTQKRR